MERLLEHWTLIAELGVAVLSMAVLVVRFPR